MDLGTLGGPGTDTPQISRHDFSFSSAQPPHPAASVGPCIPVRGQKTLPSTQPVIFLGSDNCSLLLPLRSKMLMAPHFHWPKAWHYSCGSLHLTTLCKCVLSSNCSNCTNCPVSCWGPDRQPLCLSEPPGKGIIVVPVSRVDVRMK